MFNSQIARGYENSAEINKVLVIKILNVKINERSEWTDKSSIAYVHYIRYWRHVARKRKDGEKKTTIVRYDKKKKKLSEKTELWMRKMW